MPPRPALAAPTKQHVLDQDFLLIRARLLETAAALDRLDRAVGELPSDDPRCDRLDRALAILACPGPDRAERLQLLFSREYDASWRAAFGL
ncbi:MAG: hypothetical protein KF688_17575 [Pirellulales bacterium]|nr:hypothetical protein [Pirellulales bacterium]MBX3433323.1 hypothetical protein [Pirellulales bacterium]